MQPHLPPDPPIDTEKTPAMSASLLPQADDIDPEIRAFIERTSADYAAFTGASPISMERRREIAEQVRAPWAAGGPQMAETINLTVGPRNVRMRIHIPKSGAGTGTLIYLHGGGWMIFSIDTHDRLMREYANRAGCAVIALDYSLSPEHRFPTALDDIDACLDWLIAEGASHGLSAHRIAIGGDSAGGNLSLTTALRRRDKGARMPDALLLNYAALDYESRPSWDRYDGEPYMLGTGEMRDFWTGYLGTPSTTNPYARPLLADLSGLPSVHLCIAECDILRDENFDLRERLRAAGTPVSAIVYPGATHSFLEAVSISRVADQAIEDGARWLAKQFA